MKPRNRILIKAEIGKDWVIIRFFIWIIGGIAKCERTCDNDANFINHSDVLLKFQSSYDKFQRQ